MADLVQVDGAFHKESIHACLRLATMIVQHQVNIHILLFELRTILKDQPYTSEELSGGRIFLR